MLTNTPYLHILSSLAKKGTIFAVRKSRKETNHTDRAAVDFLQFFKGEQFIIALENSF